MAVYYNFRFFLKESITTTKVISVVLCIIGCALVIFGLFTVIEITDTTNEEDTKFVNTTLTLMPPTINRTSAPPSGNRLLTTSLKDLVLGILICLDCGCIQTVTVCLTKGLREYVSHVLILGFWFALAGLALSIVLMLIFERKELTFPTDSTNLLYLGIHTFTTGFVCICYFVALDYGSAIVISIVHNSEIPMRLLFQYALARQFQPLDGSVWDIAGAIVVTISITLPAAWELIKHRSTITKEEQQHLVEQNISNNL